MLYFLNWTSENFAASLGQLHAHNGLHLTEARRIWASSDEPMKLMRKNWKKMYIFPIIGEKISLSFI